MQALLDGLAHVVILTPGTLTLAVITEASPERVEVRQGRTADCNVIEGLHQRPEGLPLSIAWVKR